MSTGTGQCRLTTWIDPATMEQRLRIDQADPVIRISADMLQEVSIATERGETTQAMLHGSGETE